MRVHAAVVVVALAIGVGAGRIAGVWTEGEPPAALTATETDVGFARDMIRHHEQAVAMAEIVRSRTADPELRAVAIDISLTQQSQIGRMRGWIDAWGMQATRRRPAMTWMGHQGAMPGMASPAQLAQLQSGELLGAQHLFVELMIDHHRGGITMAEAAATAATRPEVRALAQSIMKSQAAEIDTLQNLALRLAAP